MKIRIDITGQRYGMLTVMEFLYRHNKHSMFRCKCDCGNETVVTSNNLRRNHTTSCGCASSKHRLGKMSVTHGMSGKPLYTTWNGMINRCYWDGHNRTKHYKQKGITMCDEWRNSFEAFRDWAMANGWEKGLQIDRIDNDKGYYPENCRFATVKQQSRNRTTNVNITIDGVTKVLKDWCADYGMEQTTVRQRLKKGWPPKYALSVPPGTKLINAMQQT